MKFEMNINKLERNKIIELMMNDCFLSNSIKNKFVLFFFKIKNVKELKGIIILHNSNIS